MTATRQPLLELDPDLGALLSDGRQESAQRELVVRTHTLDRGPWDAERLRDAGVEHVGLLLLEGLIAREVVLADNVSCELLGPGDVVRPWQRDDAVQLLRAETRWTVVDDARLAVLDRRIAVRLSQFPEVNVLLIDRLAERTQRLAIAQAAAQLNGVERRVMALFWHFAERWGKVGPRGVTFTLPVPHRLIAELVGARRPTVSTALGALAERGELLREGDTWLLMGDPVGLPEGEAVRIIRGRRRRLDAVEPAQEPGPEPALPATGRIRELHEALEALRAENESHREDWQALQAETRELMARLERGREQRRLRQTR